MADAGMAELQIIEELKLTKSLLQSGALICQGDDDPDEYVDRVRQNRRSIQDQSELQM